MKTAFLKHLAPEFLAQFINLMASASSTAEDAEDYEARDEADNLHEEATLELIRRVGKDEAETLICA